MVAAVTEGDAMQLTPNFSLEELTVSDTARRRRISNAPTPAHLRNLRRTAALLEEIRALFGVPLQVTSGYRNPQVNALVGGVPTSAHALGLAADFHVKGLDDLSAAKRIRDSGIVFDQLNHEAGRSVHVGLQAAGKTQRRQVLRQPGGPGSPVFDGLEPAGTATAPVPQTQRQPAVPVTPPPAPQALAAIATAPAEALASSRFVVIARDGLRLRSGPSQDFPEKRTLPSGTVVNVIGREGLWALVDLEGDGQADGFMNAPFLRALDAPAAPTAVTVPTTVAAIALAAAGTTRDITGLVTPSLVRQTFPRATPQSNLSTHLPFVLAGLRARHLGDRAMVTMAIATIRAETEGFLPIDEGISAFNTRRKPFDLYEPGTQVATDLGNTQPGDGARFKGRGYIQLTGRDNYQRIGRQVGVDLISQPQVANDPGIAGLILAQFLKNREAAIRAAMAAHQLAKARRLVNGGSHGLDRFVETYEKAMALLPA
jgi:hypothetical protein